MHRSFRCLPAACFLVQIMTNFFRCLYYLTFHSFSQDVQLLMPPWGHRTTLLASSFFQYVLLCTGPCTCFRRRLIRVALRNTILWLPTNSSARLSGQSAAGSEFADLTFTVYVGFNCRGVPDKRFSVSLFLWSGGKRTRNIARFLSECESACFAIFKIQILEK